MGGLIPLVNLLESTKQDNEARANILKVLKNILDEPSENKGNPTHNNQIFSLSSFDKLH